MIRAGKKETYFGLVAVAGADVDAPVLVLAGPVEAFFFVVLFFLLVISISRSAAVLALRFVAVVGVARALAMLATEKMEKERGQQAVSGWAVRARDDSPIEP